MKSHQIAFLSRTRKRISARKIPHVRTVAAVLTELNIIAVRALLRFEQKYKFMLAPIEGPYPRIVLDPHTAVDEFVVNVLSCCDHFSGMSPIHAHKMKRMRSAILRQPQEHLRQKLLEFFFAHFSRGHGEFSMSSRA
jgi:hypothetical protein